MNNIFIETELANLEARGMRRSLREVSSPQDREIVLDGKRVLNFCSNNYLGLANDARLKDAAIEAIAEFGLGSGASRLVCGNMSPHTQLEQELAKFKKTEAALVFSSGYMANVGIISALVDRDDIVFSDKLNHASIIDGIILSRAELKRYPHNDMQALEDGLKNAEGLKRKLIVTDTVFSMDGDVAHLMQIVELAKKYNALVMVDEAHGFGVLGPNGGGLVEELGLHGQVDLQMGTFSKAAGCFGAYVCCSKSMRDYLINHSRSFIYTTSLPPALAQAARVAIKIIQEDQDRRRNVINMAEDLRSRLKIMGFNTLNSVTPIIPIIFGDAQETVAASRKLLNQGIYVGAIRPPTVPQNTARLRVTLMATHTKEDMERFCAALRN